MIHGVDTDFLVALEIRNHRFHRSADQLLDNLLDAGHSLALLPQTLAEFIHIATDPRRLVQPLAASEAIARAEFWWQASEVTRLYPNAAATTRFFEWIRQHRLGRKRILDTLLAATLHTHDVKALITNNTADFVSFASFNLIPYPD